MSVIASFRDTETERLWRSGKSRRLPADLHRRALWRDGNAFDVEIVDYH